MSSLSTHYTDYWKLDKVWIQIPANNMVGKTYPIYSMDDDTYIVHAGAVSPLSISFDASEFAHETYDIMAGGATFGGYFLKRGVFSVYYKECDITELSLCETSSTSYDLELYMQGSNPTSEGYFSSTDAFNMQIFLGGGTYGLYGDQEPATARYIFAARKGGLSGTHTVMDGYAPGGNIRRFGMYSYGGAGAANFGVDGDSAPYPNSLSFSVTDPDIPGWKNPDQQLHAGNSYTDSAYQPYHQHSKAIAYYEFSYVTRTTTVGGFTTVSPGGGGGGGGGPGGLPPGGGSVDPCSDPYHRYVCWIMIGGQTQCMCMPECGGTVPSGEIRPPNRRPTPPTEGPSPGPPNGTGASMLSCLPCGPCTITSKPYIDGIVNGSGVPTSILVCNTTMHPVSSKMCAALLQIMAPIKQESYRVGQILFWAGIDDSGKLVSLSDPIYTDRVTAITPTTNIMSLPVSMREVTPGNAVSQFNTYNISPLKVYRTQDNLNSVTSELNAPASDHYEEMRMWYLKDSIGRLQFNPVTQKFQNIELTAHQFRTLSRTQTAANYDQSNYSMLYCPSDGYRVYEPLTLADGSQYIGWKNQGAGYSAGSKICYEVEWHTVSKTLTGYDDTLSLVGGLNSLPIYHYTSNTRALTGRYVTRGEGQGLIAMDRGLSRPQGRKPVASGTSQLDHRDHSARRYDLYNTQSNTYTGMNTGYLFDTQVAELCGKAFNITNYSYPGTTAPSVTSNRLLFEYKNTLWDIADFSMFTSLCGTNFGLFLHTMNKLSLHSPLTADYSALELIGFCTYNGSLTAADGSYYCAAIARGNIPTWCTPITGLQDNFVICTSGCNLVLPYIVHRPYP